MKSRLVMLVVSMIFLAGCLGNKWQSGVKDNVVYSTFPEVAIKIDSDFEYIDKTKTNQAVGSEESDSVGNSTVEQFLFADRMTQKFVNVRIQRLGSTRGSWVVDITKHIPSYIATGYEEYFGKSYQYIVFSNKDETGVCYLVKLMSRVAGANGNTMLNVFYSEVLYEKLQSLDCDTQLKLEHFSSGQKAYYDEFIKNCEKTMKFIDIASLNLDEK